MELSAPKYYKEFTCIADRCRHSCCVGWEIDVDEEAICRYEQLSSEYGKRIRESISREDPPHFMLCAGERCPHLEKSGLCAIILHCGEEYLCDICREHPRFYHNTVHGLEVGIGMACEEAARIILNSPDYRELVTVEKLDGEPMISDFDAVAAREVLYGILADRSVHYRERLERICEDFGVSPASDTDAQWRDRLSFLEYLHPQHRTLFSVYSSEIAADAPHEALLERALAYFIFRHCSNACDAETFRAYLGFSLLCERLLASMLSAKENCTFEDAVESARVLSEELEYSEENTDALSEYFLQSEDFYKAD